MGFGGINLPGVDVPPPIQGTPFDPNTWAIPSNEPAQFHGDPNPPAGPGNVFRVSCGAELARLAGASFELRYDNNGPRVPFTYQGIGPGGEFIFNFAAPGEPPFGIWRVTVYQGWIWKVYKGQPTAVRHVGWDGRWVA